MSNSLKQPTFMDLYSGGYLMADEIDDFIDRWHEEAKVVETDSIPINEFLGMTRDEYEAWVHDASVLPHIVRARMSHASLDAVMHEHVDNMLLAARADNQTAIKALGKWLERRRTA
ncbi:hypothetical protein [Rhodopila sp.]|uniref:hypothetical protein n=1 Tax=Rhodopila sp. TaxID=2480087 RepID=UPI003D144DC7